MNMEIMAVACGLAADTLGVMSNEGASRFGFGGSALAVSL
jgi:hypothetical protein